MVVESAGQRVDLDTAEVAKGGTRPTDMAILLQTFRIRTTPGETVGMFHISISTIQ